MSETPTERRLRAVAKIFNTGTPAADAIDAGREAIALLREWVESDFYGQHTGDVRRRSRALLARCEGD